MRFVISNSHCPFFNLAAEEYFLRHTSDEAIMLWAAGPAVIVGKHQNALAEINYRFVRENNIVVARRLSGGGTVVHDLQNLNFTYITNGTPGKLINFKRFVEPIVRYLASLGINASIGEKNDITVDGFKISGNAEHVYKNRVLHHGTLLFASDLNRLRNALSSSKGFYVDNAVQSNRSEVANISNFINCNLPFGDFVSGLSSCLQVNFPGSVLKDFDDNERVKITKLVNEKYSSFDWVYGYSPDYFFAKSFIFAGSAWQVELRVEKGRICQSRIQINGKQQGELVALMLGKGHCYNDIHDALQSAGCCMGLNTSDLTFSFF
ncbi:MAG: lipoate--protein ligase [Bacteroidales bacterium]|nr:lipoate--protein ligase [Bacteroidales bacterium]